MDELIIEARLNEYTLRDANPHVPYSPAEIAADAAACREAGASIVHYHARDPETGAPSAAVEHYVEAARGIRARCDALVMPTLGASTVTDLEQRFAHVAAMAKEPATRADLVPLDLASTNLPFVPPPGTEFVGEDLVYLNSVATLRALAERARSLGAAPMAALWNVGSVRLLAALQDAGVLAVPSYVQLTLTEGGLLAGHPGTLQGLEAFLAFLPRDRCAWSVLCFGASLLPLLDPILERGGHVAIGLGDYAYPEFGTPANAEIVAHVAQRARTLGRAIATPQQIRDWLERAALRR